MHKILVSAEVLTGLEAVRLSGLTNMLDRPRVTELAFDMGYAETAFWVNDNRGRYAKGIFQGFAVAKLESEAAAPPNDRAQSASRTIQATREMEALYNVWTSWGHIWNQAKNAG
ncbi:MAG: DUF5049 domain-containing protein [Armatimonadetes bacterium]|nr:DUF5049 domain-containing protein [Armatimonadota bacterium]